MPKYEKDSPKGDEVDLSKFPLQVVSLEVSPNKTGWSRFKLTLPQSFRSLYYDDVLVGQDWRELLADFDRRLGTGFQTLF